MTSLLLFCTAQVPIVTINTLLTTPECNFFSLVRDPSQSTFDLDSTEPPVAPFETGFVDYTSIQIRDYIAERLPKTPSGSNLEPCQYAILDAITIDTNTVVLGHAYSTVDMRDVDTMTEEERQSWELELDNLEGPAHDAWREWRVRFEDAEKMITSLAIPWDFTPKLYNEQYVAAFTEEDGIFDLKAALHAYLEEDIIAGSEL